MLRKIRLFTIIVFCVILYADILTVAVRPVKEYSDMENRRLAAKPEFSLKRFFNGKYQKKYEKYLGDQFTARDKWVDISGRFQVLSGKKDINGVYIGKDGYLLDGADEMNYDKEQADENVTYLSSFLNDVADMYGKENVSCLIIPQKIEVLSDKLPDFAAVPEYNGIIKKLKGKIKYKNILIDNLADVFSDHADEYIYYRTDHHWTTLGAYYAYKRLMEQTNWTNPHQLDYYKREKVFTDFYGTTYNKVHIKTEPDIVELFHSLYDENVYVNMDDGEIESDSLYFAEEAKNSFNRYNVFLLKNTFKIEIDTEADTCKTLLLLKDSFANCLVPFLTEYYDKIIMIDYRYGKTRIGDIMNEYPDISNVLVAFNIEKFIQNTDLDAIADTSSGIKSDTMEEFDADSFFDSFP